MSQATKIGLVTDSVKRASHRASQNVQKYAIRKRDNILSKPIIRTVNSRFQYLISQENIDNVRLKCDEYYHWVAGTEVTEVQERARELESKLNVKRKNMIEAREQIDNVTERLRGIAVELENTKRGDPKHLHLRQLEYETIQEEMKLSKHVQRTEFEERETFTWLMNAVRESHETERNYNQRIKMLSLIGAAIGPFIGYMFSARLNAMRFRRMEEIINKKLELLSFTTLNTIREIHGLEPELMSDAEKQGLISRIVTAFYTLQSLLEESYKIAITNSADLMESIKETADEVESSVETHKVQVTQNGTETHKEQASHKATETNEVQATQKETEQEAQTEQAPSVTYAPDNADTKQASPEAATQVSEHKNPLLIEKIIVEKTIPQKINFAELPEYKSLMSMLKLIEDKQENLKHLLLTSQEIQEASKIEVSVNSSDEEIISMLQADQKMVRKILLSLSDLLQDSRTSIGSSLESIISNIDTLSMKISNNSELYVGNLEHSKIINDIAKSLEEVKSNIDMIETYYINDVNRQFTELASIHGDLSNQINGVKSEIDSQLDSLGYIKESISCGFGEQDRSNIRIEGILDEINGILRGMKAEKSIDSTINKVDDVIGALADIKSLLEFTITENNVRASMTEEINTKRHLEKTLAQFEEKILRQYKVQHDAISDKIDSIVIPSPTVIYTKDASTATETTDHSEIFGESSNILTETPKVSSKSPDISNISPDISKISPPVSSMPLETHEIPPEVSDIAQEVLEISPAVSDTCSKVSETSPQFSETSAEISVITPEVLETSPKISDIAPGVSEKSVEISVIAPKVLETSPKISDIAPGVSEKSAEASDVATGISDKAAAVSDTSPAVSDIGPEVSETSKAVSDIAPEVSVSSLEISSMLPETSESPEVLNTAPQVLDNFTEVLIMPPEISNISCNVSEDNFLELEGFPQEIMTSEENIPDIVVSAAENVEANHSSDKSIPREDTSTEFIETSNEGGVILNKFEPIADTNFTPVASAGSISAVENEISSAHHNTIVTETTHVGFPGVNEPKKSTVYLYSVFVTVYTVINYFFR